MFCFFKKKIGNRVNYNQVYKKKILNSEIMSNLYLKKNNKKINNFLEIITSPRKLFWRSFLSGIARGIGSAIGFSILGAILIYIFRSVVMLNLPIIGAFFKDIWNIIQKS